MLQALLQKTKDASYELAKSTTFDRNNALNLIATSLKDNKNHILENNKLDMQNAKNLSQSMQKRLELNETKIIQMANSLKDIAKLKDPLHRVLDKWVNEAGLEISKVSVPLGVIGVIYESRPNVTSDVSALCLKSGNACVLKGGKEALNSNKAILKAIKQGLDSSSLPLDCINFLESSDREITHQFIKSDEFIDLLIPRGGEGLINFVKTNATIPIIKHDKGICHLYIHKDADISKAIKIAINAKTSYPAACNAIETLLLDGGLDSAIINEILDSLKSSGINLMLDESLEKFNSYSSGQPDFNKEYGINTLNVKLVADYNQALEHIKLYGSMHSESIVTENNKIANAFLDEIDCACVYVNASTRFSDGGEFGFGAEVGISTSKLHARGPMGLDSLQSYKYKIVGNGQIR